MCISLMKDVDNRKKLQGRGGKEEITEPSAQFSVNHSYF